MKLKKNDIVLAIKGKDRKKKGKILKVLSEQGKILVEGMNVKKKHMKPRRAGQKGQIVEVVRPFSAANVKLVCPKCGRPTRVGFKIMKNEAGKKTGKARVCKKCNAEI